MKDQKNMPELPAEDEYPAELTERYELLECLSEREQAGTLLVRNRESGSLAVVKCYFNGHPQYDQQEPDALKQLDVAPLPHFLMEAKNEASRVVVREYMPGKTLTEILREKTFSEAEILDIGEKLCDQLTALHTNEPPIIHRDIKPQNVVMLPDGTPVLIDFGIARVRSDAGADTLISVSSGFAPPEQYGFAQTDARSDLFALGVLLNCLKTGSTSLPEKPKDPLDQVIARCAAFDPARRYASAAQVKRALEKVRPESRRNRKLGLAAAVLCAVILLAFGVRALLRRPAVTFSEPLIEQAVRLHLGLASGDALTEEMLERVTTVFIVADTAYPDADAFYPGISAWYAAERQPRGTISSLADLALLPNLEQIGIVAQELTDISPLSGLSRLNKVEFKHNRVQDLSPLSGLPLLSSAGFNDNPVRDISPLKECPSLAFLDLCDVRTYDAKVIAELGNFDLLDIANPTDSWKYLAGKSVLALHLGWTGITDLHILDEVTRLEILQINHTAVTDLSPLTLHPGLKSLNIAAIPATDFSPLLSLPELRELIVSADQLPLVKALGGVSWTVLTE